MAKSKLFRCSVDGCDFCISQSDTNVSSRSVSEALRVLRVLSKYRKDLHNIGNIIQKGALCPAILTPVRLPHIVSTGCPNPADMKMLDTNKFHISACFKKPGIMTDIVQIHHYRNQKRLLQRTRSREKCVSEKFSVKDTSCRDDKNEYLIKKPPHQRVCQYEQMDCCCSNDLTNKQQADSHNNHLHRQPVFRRSQSRTPSAPNGFDLKYKNVSPLRSQHFSKQSKNSKTAPANGRSQTRRKTIKDPDTQTFSLSAWDEGQNVVQYSCSQDDLSILRKAVVLSSRHSSFQKDCSQKDITMEVHNQSSSGESLCAKQVIHTLTVSTAPQLPMCKEEVNVRNNQITFGLNGSSQEETDYKPRLTEQYTSSDTSNSHHTQSIWSKFSVVESERTSNGYLWETTTQEDLKSTPPKHETILGTYRRRVAKKESITDHPKKQHQNTKHQSCVKKSQERISPRLESAIILSELSTNRYLIPGLHLFWSQLGRIPIHSPDRSSSRRLSTNTEISEETQNQPYSSDKLTVSSMQYIVRHSNPHNLFRNLRLVKSISSPDLSTCSEEIASQYLVLSQFIQLLYSSQKILGNRFFKDVLGSDVCSHNDAYANISTRMMKIIHDTKKRDAAFRSFNDRPFYIWKWRLFLVAFVALLLFCALLALVATLEVFKYHY